MSFDPSPLDYFVRTALEKGEDRSAISTALASAGWPPKEIASALSAYADLSFAVPVPRPHASLSARETFLYLVLFTALYISIWNFGNLLFDFINRTFPDVTQRSYPSFDLDSIRWDVASLIIAFPVFLWTSNHIGKRLDANPAERLSPVRHWLTYLTLFIAIAVLIGDGITVVYNMLGGELTIRFVLKAFVVGGIAACALFYYLRDLRHGTKEGE
ncbi:MAG: DUF5671 domain-containing protein [Gemmatimonadota bacterium]